MAEEKRDISIGANAHDLFDLGFQLAIFSQVVMTELDCFVPRQGSVPAVGIASVDDTAIGSHGAERDRVIKDRQPNRGDAAVDHLAHGFRRYGRRLSAADVAGPTCDRRHTFLIGPAIHIFLDVARGFYWIFAGNAFEQ